MNAKLNFSLLTLVLTCFVIGGAFLGIGYWLGQRSQQQQNKFWTAHADSLPGANTLRNSSPEMQEFMQNQATLRQKMSELHKQNLIAHGAPDPKLDANDQQANAPLLQRQKELSQIISEQQAKNPIPAPPPLQLPSSASPQLRSYLTAHDQLMRDEVAFMNKHRTDDPATRQAAMQQWRQQNAARFQKLQLQSQAMVQNASTPAASPTTITVTSPAK